MKRQKNGIWKLTDKEMKRMLLWAYETAQRYDQLGVHAIAGQTREIRKEILIALDNKATGFITNAE